MQRVAVIGPGGAGKSAVARQIGERLGLPVVHLDSLFWRSGWVETPPAEWRALQEGLVQRPAWVMDGNYGGTMDVRVGAADTVVLLDLRRGLCLWRVVRRWVRYRARPRPDMAEGCPERFSWEFLRWIWSYPRSRRPRVLALVPPEKLVRLRTRAEVRGFLDGLG